MLCNLHTSLPHAAPKDGVLVDAEGHQNPVLAELVHRTHEQAVLLPSAHQSAARADI